MNDYLLIGGPRDGQKVVIVGESPPQLILDGHMYMGAELSGSLVYISTFLKPEMVIPRLIERYTP